MKKLFVILLFIALGAVLSAPMFALTKAVDYRYSVDSKSSYQSVGSNVTLNITKGATIHFKVVSTGSGNYSYNHNDFVCSYKGINDKNYINVPNKTGNVNKSGGDLTITLDCYDTFQNAGEYAFKLGFSINSNNVGSGTREFNVKVTEPQPTVVFAPETAVAQYTFNSTGWATFGIALPKGKAVNGLKVGDWTTQTDIKNRWSDGSIKYAILTTKVLEQGSYEIFESAVPTGTFNPTIPVVDLTLEIENAGTYESVLPNNVTNDLWLDGPLVKEWRFHDIPKSKVTDVEHPFLSNIWDIRIYNDNTGTIDAVVENVRDVEVATGVVYSTEIKINGVIAFKHAATREPKTMAWLPGVGFTSQNHNLVSGSCIRILDGPQKGVIDSVHAVSGNTIFALSHPLLDQETITNTKWEQIFYHRYGARWRKNLTINSFEKAEYETDFAPFFESNAIPEFMPSVSSNPRPLQGKEEWGSMSQLGLSFLSTYLNEAGGREEIGIYPAWQARFVVNQTTELKELLLSLGDLAGSFSAHFSKDNPSQIWTVVEKPDYWLDGRAPAGYKPLNNLEGTFFFYDNAHAGSLAFIPYLVTGDRYYSDEMMYYANFAIMYTNGSDYATTENKHRQGVRGLLWNNQIRGIAWAFRNVTDAANYLPDSSQYQTMFRSVVEENLKDFDRYAKEKELEQVIALPLVPGVYGDYHVTTPWEQAFLAWSVSHAIETRDVSGAVNTYGSVFRDKIFQTLYEPAIKNTAFSPKYIPSQGFIFGKMVNGVLEYFKTWEEVSESYKILYGEPELGWNYGAEMWPALMMAVKSGYPGACTAYQFFLDSTNHPINFYYDMQFNSSFQGYALKCLCD